MVQPKYDPFKAGPSPVAPPPFSDQPRTGTVADLLNPLYARSMATPAPYATDPINVSSGFGRQAYGPQHAIGADQGKIGEFDDAGKSSMVLVPGQGASVPQPGTTYTQEGKPYIPTPETTSTYEALLKQLTGGLISGLPQELQNVIGGGITAVGNLLDIPTEFLGNLPALPIPAEVQPGFSTDPRPVFERVPDTEEKQQVMELMRNDPVHALWYMSEYLRRHEIDIAHGLGVSPLVTDYYLPVNNLGDQIMKTLGLTGLPSRLLVRSLGVTDPTRNIQSSILDADPATLNPALAEIRRRYLEGEINDTELKDVLTREGFGLSNNAMANMIGEIITDPMNLALGAGFMARAAESGAQVARVGRTISLARERLPLSVLNEMDASAVAKVVQREASRGITVAREDAVALARDPDRYEWLINNGHKALADEALASLPPQARHIIQLDPVLSAAAKLVDAINSPFGLPGKVLDKARGGFRNGQRIAAFRSRASVEGMVMAYDPANVLALTNLERGITGNSDNITRNLGRGAANMEVAAHRDSLARMVTARGKPPAFAPDLAVKAMGEVYHSRLAMQVEGLVRRVKTQFLPATRLGRVGYEATMERARRTAAHNLKRMIPAADEAMLLKWTSKADEDMLALIEHLRWGHEIGAFTNARTADRVSLASNAAAERAEVAKRVGKRTIPKQEARAQRAEAAAARAQRYTPIGPKQLTYDRAKRVLASAKRKDLRAVREAVDQYDDLYENFAARGLNDDELLRDMRIYLTDLTAGGKDGGRLTVVVGRDKLPRHLRDWVDEQRDFARRAGTKDQYEVGLAPSEEHRWRAVYDDDGRLVGVNPWTDVVPDEAEVRGLNRLDVIRQKLFRPIRGERILEEARRTFRALAVNEYGLARSEANALFSAIRKKSADAGTMPRALSGSELNELLNDMKFPEAVRQRLGSRGMARLVAHAFEGDLRTVGLTQKISGRAKRIGASKLPGNNWLSVVAEKLYPLARFTYNPIFLAQEATEPFFWNLLRGHKPGMWWKPKDVASLEMLRRSGILGEWADQWEYSPAALLLFGAKEATEIGGPATRWGKAWSRFIGSGRRVQSLAELKRLNYIRQMAPEYGDSFVAAIKEHAAPLYDLLVRETGTSDPGRLANYYWINKAMQNTDDPRAQAWLFDANLPSDMGKMTQVRDYDLARHHNFVDANALRKAVADGSYSEAQFRDSMVEAGMNPAYIDRAWEVASHMGAQAWWDKYADVFTEVFGHSTAGRQQALTQAKAHRQVVKSLVEPLGYTEEEFLALHARKPPKFVSSTGALPRAARYQLAEPDNMMRFYGKKLLPQNDPIIQRVARMAEEAAGPMDPAQTRVLEDIEQASTMLDRAAPEGNAIEIRGAGIDGDTAGHGAPLLHKTGSGRTVDEFWQMAFDTLGGNNIERVAKAHRNMAASFYMLADSLPDDVVWRLTDDFIAQPYDIHKHRARIEERDALAILGMNAAIFREQGDLNSVASTISSRFGRGQNFFDTNMGYLLDLDNDWDNWRFGEPNSGLKVALTEEVGPDGELAPTPDSDYMFGWYDENGELAALAHIRQGDKWASRNIESSLSPGSNQRRIAEGEFPFDFDGPRWDVPESHVVRVGVAPAKKGKGYYSKMADFITEDGQFNWADVTGRDIYTQQGAPAAAAWLKKKDHETLQQARETLAARMMAGFSHIISQNDLDPATALQHMMSIIEAGAGKHRGGVPYAYNAITEMLDFSRNPDAHRLVNVTDAEEFVFANGSEAYANWRQHLAMSALFPPGARPHADAILPSTQGASAFGYPTQDFFYDMGGSGKRPANVPEGTGLSDFMGIEPRDNYLGVSQPLSNMGRGRLGIGEPVPSLPGADRLDEAGLQKALRKDFRRDRQWKADFEAALQDADEAMRGDLMDRFQRATQDRMERLAFLRVVRRGGVKDVADQIGWTEEDFWRQLADLYDFDVDRLGIERFQTTVADEVARLPEVARRIEAGIDQVWDENIYLGAAKAKGKEPMPEYVTPAMARHMREWYSSAAEQANASRLLGHTDWTAADLQAIDVARYQQVFNTGGFGFAPENILSESLWAMGYEVHPHPNTIMADALPDAEDVDDAALELIQSYLGKWWAPRVQEISGVQIIGSYVGPGRARAAHAEEVFDPHAGDYVTEISDEWEAWGPRTTMLARGSDEAIAAAVVATGSVFQRKNMWATTLNHIEDITGWRGGSIAPTEQVIRNEPLGLDLSGVVAELPGQGATPLSIRMDAIREIGQGNANRAAQVDTVFDTLDMAWSQAETTLDREALEAGLRDIPEDVWGPAYTAWSKAFEARRGKKIGADYEIQKMLSKPELSESALAKNFSIVRVTDFILAGDTGLDDLAGQIDSLISHTNLGYQTLYFPDGSIGIRVIHENDTLADLPIRANGVVAADVKVKHGRVRAYRHEVNLKNARDNWDTVQRPLRDQVRVVSGRRPGALGFENEVPNPAQFAGGKASATPEEIADFDSALNWIAHTKTDPWLIDAERAGFDHVTRALRDRYRGEAVAQANLAYYRYAPDAIAEHRARAQLVPPPARGYHFQRTPGRGVRAATHVAADLDATLFFLKSADATSAIHETFHWFVGLFEDSMIKGLNEAYAAAHSLRPRLASAPGTKPLLSRRAEEWLAGELEKYATTGVVRDPVLQAAFNTMGKLVKKSKAAASLPEAHPAVKDLFDRLFKQENVEATAVPFNPDEWRFLSAARYMLSQSEDEAHKTHYFARGRNLIERSINHPYLGYYPASYMWGKVVPELVRFLVTQPFGVKAPLWGYEVASQVLQGIQLQLNTDKDFQEWVEGHPELIRFVAMMTPGTPWDIPVNLPAWARHTVREEYRNEVRRERGLPEKNVDLVSEVVDSAHYAFGPLRFATTLSDIKGEFDKFGAPEEPKSTGRRGGVTIDDILAGRDPDMLAAQSELAPLLNTP